MALSLPEMRALLRLARLERADPDAPPLADDATLARLATEIGRILDHVRSLEAVSVEGVAATPHGFDVAPRERTDAPATDLDAEDALSGAPARIGAAIAVPKVVE